MFHLLSSLAFWTSLSIVFYTYIGYGILLWIIKKTWMKYKDGGDKELMDNELPEVTFIVAAYNEEDIIAAKIENTIQLDYPVEKLKIWFITDGTTDRTREIIKLYKGVENFHSDERKGKIHAVNRIMKLVKTPIVIFSDANTFLNEEALRKIVRHYQNPQVGGVAGEKRIRSNESDNASGSGEGLYWKYESFLKKMDSDIYSVVGAAGELFSLRTDLYFEPPADTLIEDFVLSVTIASNCHRFIYEPEAYATEAASITVEDEWKRKVRISAGGLQAVYRLRRILNPIKYGIFSFQFVSHRFLRWAVCPFLLLLILISNAYLASNVGGFYTLTLYGQLLFYLLAGIGHVLRNKNVRIKGFFVPYYFTVMNLSVYFGLIRLINGRQTVVWEKAKRSV